MTHEQDILDLKATIADMHSLILTLTEGLWAMNVKLDEMMMAEAKHNAYAQDYDKFVDRVTGAMQNNEPVVMTHDDEVGQYGNEPEPILTPEEEQRAKEMYREQVAYEKQLSEIPTLRARGRPRRETTPEPQKAPTRPEVPETLPPLPEPPKKAPEPAKPSIMERILGKDASDKKRLRDEKVAQLQKEMDILKSKN